MRPVSERNEARDCARMALALWDDVRDHHLYNYCERLMGPKAAAAEWWRVFPTRRQTPKMPRRP